MMRGTAMTSRLALGESDFQLRFSEVVRKWMLAVPLEGYPRVVTTCRDRGKVLKQGSPEEEVIGGFASALFFSKDLESWG